MDGEHNIPFSKDSFINENLTEDITVYAKWNYKQYTAKFVADGNTVSTKTFTVADSIISNMPNVPEKDGYTGEWEEFTLATNDITINAVYTAITYNITFVGVKGENTNKTTFTIESDDIILSDLSCEGYAFEGWHKGNTKVTKIDKGTFGNITLTAKWTAITYNITFVGVKGENTNDTTFTVESDDIILSDLSYDGYTFDGWYNGDKKVTKIEKGTFGDITLTAKWTLTEYVVTFKLDGKEIGTTTYTIEDKNITLPTVDDKKGYTVVWDKYTLTTGDITINVYYQAKNVTVTFDYDGADGNNTVQSVVIGYEEKVSFPVPTKSGQTFKGWQVNGQTFNNDDVWTIDEDCTVIALWEKVKPFTRVDENDDKSDTGSFIYFGSYPQTDVTESMSTVLADKVATLPTSDNLNGWTSYKYYIEDSNETDFMWYKDVEYSGSKYRAVYFTSYRPYLTDNSSSTDNTFQDDNGYYTSNVYWFKYEPIKWRILEESNGKATLLAEMILDSQDYNYTISSTTIDGKTVYANNYEYSSIRKWLNDNFYNTAFNELEKALIQTVEVDNSESSTNPDSSATYWNSGVNKYACNNTNDKVWLLSEQEVTRESYGFATSTGETTTRQKKTTAYGKCQGCWTNTANYAGNGYWWLRSPSYNYNYRSSGVDRSGNSSIYDYVNGAYFGVVPALQISL